MDVGKLLASLARPAAAARGRPARPRPAVQSPRSRALSPRIDDADRVVESICPYCAVGCGQLVYVKDGDVTHIEGDPASPISRGRLCPRGRLEELRAVSPLREYKVKYRRPYGTAWEELDLETAMDMIAQRIVETRAANWEDETETARRRTGRWRSATSAARRSTTRRTT